MPKQITKLRVKLLTSDLPAFMIAGRSGVHASRLSEYSLGQKPIPAHHVVMLCKYFECEPEDIIGWMDIADIDLEQYIDH